MLLGGAHELVRLDEVAPAVYRVALVAVGREPEKVLASVAPVERA